MPTTKQKIKFSTKSSDLKVNETVSISCSQPGCYREDEEWPSDAKESFFEAGWRYYKKENWCPDCVEQEAQECDATKVKSKNKSSATKKK